MKKPVKGKKKKVQEKNAKKRFVSKEERVKRRNKWQEKLRARKNLEKAYNEAMFNILNNKTKEFDAKGDSENKNPLVEDGGIKIDTDV